MNLPEQKFDHSSVVPPELQQELDDWDRASDDALALVERLAGEMESDEQG